MPGVYPCAKIRIFKQITTDGHDALAAIGVFILVQRYEFLSKSQHKQLAQLNNTGVYPCAKIRIFKQITTRNDVGFVEKVVFILVQRYEFLSKSQHHLVLSVPTSGVYPCAKIRIFKQITTNCSMHCLAAAVFILVQRYEFLSKSQLWCRYRNFK